MSIIIDKVRTFLQKDGYNPINSPNNNDLILLIGLNFKNSGQYNVHFLGKDASTETDAILLTQTEFPIKVPPNKREKILSFLNEINKDSWYTFFSIDMETGSIICKSSTRSTSNEALSEDIFKPVLFSSCGRLDGLQPVIMDLIYSEKTVDAVLREMNQSTK